MKGKRTGNEEREERRERGGERRWLRLLAPLGCVWDGYKEFEAHHRPPLGFEKSSLYSALTQLIQRVEQLNFRQFMSK